MNRYATVAGIAGLVIGGAVVANTSRRALAAGAWNPQLGMALTAGLVLLATALLMLASSWNRSASPAVLRLDCFLPALRRPRPGDPASEPSRLYRLARTLLPTILFSDRQTKRRGQVRQTLRRLGISWLSAPVRRSSQTVCFIVFMGLFFYVCWPYDARPPGQGAVSQGWQFIEIGQSDEQLRFATTQIPVWIQGGSVVYAREATAEPTAPTGGTADETESVPLRVVQIGEQRVSFAPLQQLSDEVIDRLLLGSGSWDVFARDPTAWPSYYADNLQRKQWVPAELFLVIDPLVSLSTAIAARSWVWSLASAAIILTICLLIPRGFCGYLLPFGDTHRPIRLVDWTPRDPLSRGGGRLVGAYQVLPAGRDVAGSLRRHFGFRIRRCDPGDHARDADLGKSTTERRRAGLASCSSDASGAFDFGRNVLWGVVARPAEATILVQVRLSERGHIFAGQSAEVDRAQGRIELYPLQQMRGNLPVRCHQTRLYHAWHRLHAVPKLCGRVSDTSH